VAAAVNAEIDQAVKDFAPGILAVAAPRRMRQARPRMVTARVAAKDLPGDIAQGLRQRGTEASVEQVEIGMTMRAHLQGDDFNITNVSTEMQYVRPAHTTEWTWEVVARHHGVHHLHLRMTVLVRTDGYTAIPSDVEVRDKTIRVDVDPWYTTERIAATEWNKLLPSGGLLAVAGAGIARLRKRRHAARPPPPENEHPPGYL
jgi:hypothetical protein